jgi:mRNA interferase MazF
VSLLSVPSSSLLPLSLGERDFGQRCSQSALVASARHLPLDGLHRWRLATRHQPAKRSPAGSGSRPAKRRPVVVITADTYNQSRLATVVALVITSNTDLATMPGNVFLPGAVTGLPRDSVVNVTAAVTLNKADLAENTAVTPLALMREVDRGLRNSLDL